MTTANIVLSAKDNTRAAFASLEGSLRATTQSVSTLGSTVQGLAGFGAVALLAGGLLSSLRGAVDLADGLNKLSQRTGIATENLSQLQYAAKLSDVSSDSLNTSIKKLNISIAEGAAGNKEKIALFRGLGINIRDTSGQVKSADKVLLEISDRFATAADGAGKTAYAVALLGKSGDEMVPFLNQGAQAIKDLQKEADKLGLTISGDFAKKAEEFNDNLTRVQVSSQKVAIALGSDLVEGLGKSLKAMADATVEGGKLAGVVAFIQQLFTGDDRYKNDKALVELTDKLLTAENALSKARAAGMHPRGIAAREKYLEQINAELKTTLAYRKMLDEADAKAAASQKKLDDSKKGQLGVPGGSEAQSAYKSISAELEKQVKLLAAQSEVGRNLTDGEKFRIEINEKINSEATKLSATERAALLAQAEKVANLKDEEERRQKNVKLAQQGYAAELEFQEEIDKAEREAAASRESGRATVRDILLVTEEQTRLLELEASLVNATDQQRGFALEKLRIELQLRKDILEVQRRLQFDAVAQQEAIDLLNADAQVKIANSLKRSILDEFNRTTAQISEPLADALLRGFEKGEGFVRNFIDTLKNLFKTLVLTPTIKAIIQPVAGALTGALGVAGPANAATGSNLLSTASNAYSLANIGSTFASTAGALGGVAGAEFAANFIGAVGGDAIGALATGLQASGAVAGSAFASAALAAVPYVAVAGVVASALGLFRSKKIVDGGLQGELGGQINDYALQRRGGSLFSGPSYSVLDQGVSAQNDELQKAYSAIRNTVAGMAEQLGIGNDAIKAFTVQLGNDLIHPDTGGFGIKTQGLSQDEILKKIEAALQSANEQLAAFALGTTVFTRDGETAVQTLGRLSGSLGSVNSVFKTLGLTLADASLAGADAASKFVDSFGGADQFAQVASSYYQNFYTEAERTAATVQALTEKFGVLGLTMPTSRDGLSALIKEQQRLQGATSPVVVELFKLSETFASVVPAAASAADAIAESGRAFGVINTNAGLRAATEAEATAAADRRDVIAGRRAAEQIRAAEQQESAQAAAAVAQEAATQAAQARTEAEQAMRQAYEAEIRALDEVIAKRDLAVQALETAFQRESGVLQQTINTFGDLAGTLRNFVSGLNSLADTPEQSTARLRARFDATIAAALGGDADATRNVPGAGRSFIDAASLTAATRVDMLREIARVQVATEGVIDFAEAQKTIAEQQLDALNQQVNGLLTVDQSVLSVSESIASLQQANEAAVQAESQKAILTAQVSSLITLNKSVLSVRDAILGIEQAVADVAISGFGGGEGAGGIGSVGGITAAGAFGADNIVAQAGNFVVAKDARGNLVFANVDGAGILQTSTGIDNESVARLLVQSGQDRETLNQSLLGLAAQLDASGAAYLPGSVFAGSDFGVDFRDLANGGFGGNNFTLDANAALKGPTGFGTLQANQQIAAALGIANANRELIDSYRDLNYLQEGLGLGLGGTSPVTVDELAQYRIPGFASGGVHEGGLRWVGENGPELEYTPPSRIFSNSQSNALLSLPFLTGANPTGPRTSQATSSEVNAMKAELAEVRQLLSRLVAVSEANLPSVADHTAATAMVLRRTTRNGNALVTTTETP